jgi:lipopolysaccharide transport system permease protein
MLSGSSGAWMLWNGDCRSWNRADSLNASVISGGYYRAVPQTELELPESRLRTPPQTPARDAGRDSYVTVIRPAHGVPRIDFRELWRYRELLGIFIWRDIKVRYKQTAIGAGWAVFQPLFTAVVYSLIFGRFAKFPSGSLPYPIFAFAGILAWQYFSGALNVSSSSLVSNVSLVTKVYFPRVLLPLAGVLVPLVDVLLAFWVLVAMMFWFHTFPGPQVVLAPLFILLALVSALGAGLALSALNTRFRDVPYAIPAVMQVLPFLSGVPFALNGAPEKWQWLLSVNPITTVVTGWRWCLLDGPPPVLGQALLGSGVALVLLFAGLAYFRRSEPGVADTI